MRVAVMGFTAGTCRMLDQCRARGASQRGLRNWVMKYRIVVQITDDQGIVTEEELMPEVEAESGWRCAHALWPEWTRAEQIIACGWCHAPLVACAIVACPWCERYVTTERVLEHWVEGCEA